MGTTTAAQWQNVASKATSGGSENDIIKTEKIKVLEEKKAKIIALHKRHIDLHKEAKRVLWKRGYDTYYKKMDGYNDAVKEWNQMAYDLRFEKLVGYLNTKDTQ